MNRRNDPESGACAMLIALKGYIFRAVVANQTDTRSFPDLSDLENGSEPL